jgi:hypothetical protein
MIARPASSRKIVGSLVGESRAEGSRFPQDGCRVSHHRPQSRRRQMATSRQRSCDRDPASCFSQAPPLAASQRGKKNPSVHTLPDFVRGKQARSGFFGSSGAPLPQRVVGWAFSQAGKGRRPARGGNVLGCTPWMALREYRLVESAGGWTAVRS